ncbi:MAG TPA: EpsI family protein [Candidatus Sulfotelmatobacter sp.]|nr:EpsI family protein [Candidatus Sulfotelmatobacter sp.]
MSRSVVRFLPVAILLAGTAIFLQWRSRGEVFPPRQPLQSFPEQVGDWHGTDQPIDEDALQVLGPGEFLLREYEDQQGEEPPVNLYIAYFKSQRTGDTIHSPKNCLPGAGWAPVRSNRIMVSMANHVSFPANRYVVARGEFRRLVLYWYWAHDRGVASEYWAKYYLVADSIRTNRSDGSLVRLMTDMIPGETENAAMQRMLPFAERILPLLNDYIPR